MGMKVFQAQWGDSSMTGSWNHGLDCNILTVKNVTDSLIHIDYGYCLLAIYIAMTSYYIQLLAFSTTV